MQDHEHGRYVRRSRPAVSPFVQRIGILLLAFVLLLPVARLLDRDDGQVVQTTGLPGASLSGVATGETTPTTLAAAPVVPAPTQAQPPVTTAAPAVAATPAPTAAKQAPATTAAKKKVPVTTAAKKAPATTAAKKKAPVTTAAKKAPATTVAKKAPATTAAKKAPATTAAPAPAPPPAASYTAAEVESIIRQVWPDDLEDRALAIAKRESRLIPTSRNYCCYGLFAIYYEAGKRLLNSIGVTDANQLLDPWVNTRAALAIYQVAGWDPWKL